MHNPLLWLGLSLFLVAVCLVAVLLVAIPVLQELSRTARSAEKLLDMLSRELPPTLQSLRSTGDDLSELSEQVNDGVRSASQVVTQVDQGLETVRTQAENVKRGSISFLTGLRAAWQQWSDPDADLYYEDPTLYDDFESDGEQSMESADYGGDSNDGDRHSNGHGYDASHNTNGTQPQASPEASMDVTHHSSAPEIGASETIGSSKTASSDAVKPEESDPALQIPEPMRSPSTAPRQTVDEQV